MTFGTNVRHRRSKNQNRAFGALKFDVAPKRRRRLRSLQLAEKEGDAIAVAARER
jgi:hypothetical protein